MRVKTELNFPATLKDEPILCQVCKQFDVILSILEASFTTEVGWAIVIFEAKEEELKRTFVFLQNKGVEITSPEAIP